ncbi:dnaJ homolog subfamily C member 12 isoform X2 [Anguilla anguilla]|nr:dnaJ homolog subfamily C member 12 isoform X2 [Anguilla anguilla]
MYEAGSCGKGACEGIASRVNNQNTRNEHQSEQILAEYKVRAMECHPDKNPDNPKAVSDFQKLQEAKEVLTNENTRNNYNLWIRSKITIPFRDWQALGDSVKTSMHWAVKTRKEPMLEDSKDTPLLSPQDAVCQSEEPASEMQFPETVNTPSENYSHLHFRWAAGTPSVLLRKFRNYEI